MTTKTEMNYANAIAFVATEAASATDASFRMVASGAIAYLTGCVWSKDTPADDVKNAILTALGEKSKAERGGKTQRYEVASLCLTVARTLAKGDLIADNAWGAELKAQDSIESAITFLSDRFHSVARTMSDLADLFGKPQKAKKAKTLAEIIESWLGKEENLGQSVDVPAIVAMLQGHASVNDMASIVAGFLSKFSDGALANLSTDVDAILTLRQRKAQAIAESEAAVAANAANTAQVERIAA